MNHLLSGRLRQVLLYLILKYMISSSRKERKQAKLQWTEYDDAVKRILQAVCPDSVCVCSRNGTSCTAAYG